MTQLILGILIFAGVGAAAGVFLTWLSGKFRVQESPKADRIYDILPHTECGQCGHPGCRPYANAVAEGKDTCNKCIPGGRETAAAIARIMGIDPSEAEAGSSLSTGVSEDSSLCSAGWMPPWKRQVFPALIFAIIFSKSMAYPT